MSKFTKSWNRNNNPAQQVRAVKDWRAYDNSAKLVVKLDYHPSERVVKALDALKDKGVAEFVLMGGSIRDDICGVEMSDFDIICRKDDLISGEADKDKSIQEILSLKGFKDVALVDKILDIEFYALQVEGIGSYDVMVHLDNDLYDPMRWTRAAADSMSRVIYTSQGECFASNQFIYSVVNKTAFYTPEFMDDERMVKMRKKGYTLVDENEASSKVPLIITTDNPRVPQLLPF